MRTQLLRLFFFSVAAASLTFGQGGTGTITGIVTDPSGGVVAGALVQAKNAETGVTYSGATTNAGVYTISGLPVGTYSVSTTVQNFKTYTHTNLTVGAAQVLRENISLELGASGESVTVSAQASLLKTETGDLAHNVTIQQMDDLPLLGIGTVNAGTSGYRNPYNTLLTIPGVSSYASSGQFTLNGLGGNMTETMRVEGQDATSRFTGTYDYTQILQPGADSVQEIAYQTSNYAAEYGQAGSVVINMTMKSGTNQYHGSGYEYFVNEDLNAGNPFTVNTDGIGKLRPINRRNDFGGTLGGPVVIPKIYNGRNRTFFFWSYEQFREHTSYNFTDTVPAPAYLQGNFSAISANGTCSLCVPLGISAAPLATDPVGAPIFANEIYDPNTRAVTASGQGYASPFPNNKIPLTSFNATTVDFLNLFQSLGATAQDSNLTGNYAGIIGGNRYSAIPSLKIDQTITDKDKLSFYWSYNNTQSQISAPLGNADGLPTEIGQYRGTFIPSWTTRLNYDRTISPTLLLHVGAGYIHMSFSDRAPFLSFNPSQFGLTGFLINRQFPSITGMCVTGGFFAGPACTNSTGGMQPVGTAGQIQSQSYEEKPSFNANATWAHGKHIFKGGAELYLEQNYSGNFAGVTLATGLNATQEPFTPPNSIFGAINGYTTGFGFASFLLGDYGSYSPFFGQSSTTQTPQENYRYGTQQWGLFVQDSWKVLRKLTVDYGVRYDLATPEQEQYNRVGQLDASLANPVAGGRLGAVQYANTCNCAFYKPVYPYAFGPRVGVAYQITPTTVFRAGWGYVYQFVGAFAGGIVSTNGVYNLSANTPAYVPVGQQYVNIQTPGSIVQPQWPVTNPFVYPNPGAVGPAPVVPDQNQNRPPRVNQFSFGIQQQITTNFMMEASYVGNRGVWEQGASFFTGGGPYGFFSQVSPATYAQYGLFPYPGTGPCSSGSGVCPSSTYNNYNDYELLNNFTIGSQTVQQAMAAKGHPNFLPYSSFPLSSTLQAALYPYPQFGNITITSSPTGNSIYNSLQMKATKRFSHGLLAGGAFTWAKAFVRATPQDFFNTQSSRWDLQQVPPLDLTFNFLYTVPGASWEPRWANLITKDWQIGGYANYQSGIFLTPPSSPNANFLSSEDIRVPGQPLYTAGVSPNNLSTYNPYYTQVLNPNAWEACPINSTCTASGTLYSDFHAPRTPTENANLGRNFRIGREGKYNLYIRAEFVNIFNRTLMPAPITSANPATPPSKNNLGIYTAGFGVINAYLAPGTAYQAPTQATNFVLQPRTGTLIARFSF